MAPFRMTSEVRSFPRHRPIFTFVPVALLVLIGSTGCASQRAPNLLTELPETGRHARIAVTNQHRHQVRIVLIPQDAVYEVGRVGATSSRAFRIPQQLNGMPARIQVFCATGNDLYTTQELVWGGTDVIELQVGSILNLSKFALRH